MGTHYKLSTEQEGDRNVITELEPGLPQSFRLTFLASISPLLASSPEIPQGPRDVFMRGTGQCTWDSRLQVHGWGEGERLLYPEAGRA